jgi:hypothetical protein
MTSVPARPDVPPDALALLAGKGEAERALTAALASFQAQVQAIPTINLDTVVEAAKPAFSQGLAYSVQLIDEQGRRKLRVIVMHTSGAEFRSEEWADELDDLLEAAGWMLAMLLGIPLSSEASPVEPEATTSGSLGNTGAAAEVSRQVGATHPIADAPNGVALKPLSSEEIEALHQRILRLPAEARRELTSAFREHFQVPRNARSIGDRISQRQHGDFIEHFLEEFQGQALEDVPAPPAP